MFLCVGSCVFPVVCEFRSTVGLDHFRIKKVPSCFVWLTSLEDLAAEGGCDEKAWAAHRKCSEERSQAQKPLSGMIWSYFVTHVDLKHSQRLGTTSRKGLDRGFMGSLVFCLIGPHLDDTTGPFLLILENKYIFAVFLVFELSDFSEAMTLGKRQGAYDERLGQSIGNAQ